MAPGYARVVSSSHGGRVCDPRSKTAPRVPYAPMSSRRCLAGLVQMTSVNDAAANFATCVRLTKEAARAGCKIVFFPECFSFIGAKAGEAQTVASNKARTCLRHLLP